MAKRKKGSKVQSRAKLRKADSAAKRGKPRKLAKSATRKRIVASAKPKRTRKVQQPITAVVETVVVEKTIPEAIIVAEGLDPAA